MNIIFANHKEKRNTKDIPEGMVAAGNPAKPLRPRPMSATASGQQKAAAQRV